MRDGIEVFPLGKQVRGGPGGRGDEQPLVRRPFDPVEVCAMQRHVGPSGLPADGKGEVVDVGGQVAETKQGGG